ncbi:hypothetical protein GCM10007989_08150 [Devosia pacifica]|uniref:DUF2065 domain-containing protein n=1 Tax=Devosia pacifica TaxID=1335967 RepID=A0A918S0B0_9HYPH|nr:DUF2065 domain-containing protein [Devosia pacifica]GHA15729.1 hypothetical protein GCM10007989_08150 [Devosia pacifica]
MTELLAALFLAIVIEGLIYAAFPEQMQKTLASIMNMPPASLRIAGLLAAGGGLLMLWLVRSAS